MTARPGVPAVAARLASAVLVVVVVSAIAGGCKAPAALGPRQLTQRYLELCAASKLDAAYALLTPEFQQHCDRPCFARLLLNHQSEVQRALTELRAGEVREEVLAELPLPDGTTLALLQRDSGYQSGAAAFRFARDPLEFYPQSTPEEALRSFVRLIELQRYEVAMRFVPRSLEGQVTVETLRQRFGGTGRPQLQAQLARVKRHMQDPFVVEGGSAKLPLGEGQEARLVLEDGRWRVIQLD